MKRNYLLLAFAVLILTNCQGPTATNVQPDELFTDNAVLQRDHELRVWGTADAGGTVEVSLNEASAQATADEQGRWEVTLPAMKAGGPYEMTIRGDEKKVLKNIMLGDVWVASGQSNMEWMLKAQVDNFEEEIANASYPNIRLFTVEQNTSSIPLDTMAVVGNSWLVCSPETVPDFSAVAYFFGREIHQEEGVPIGLINTTWGGTPAEAWTSEKALMQMPDFQAALAEQKQQVASGESPADLEKKKEAIIQRARQEVSGDYQPNFNTADWETMELPTFWEEADTTMDGYDGFAWFQKTINVPAQYAGKALTLHLGTIDDDDVTWFNGEKIGETTGYTKSRAYDIPANLVKAGQNTITVRVEDGGGGGGLYGDADEMYLVQNDQQLSVSIAGEWKYQARPEDRFPVTALPHHQPAMLYNAMIQPLLPYPIKGAIWYQGESNASRAQQYQTLFPLMIKDWREQWGEQFPFLFVQLANFSSDGANNDSWAYLREAQMKALDMDKTGMAVTIDIGDSLDIHPRNKQDVGDRLATAAKAVAYGDENVYSGPVYQSMRTEGDSVILTFDYVGEGLMKVPDEELQGFVIAGEDQQFVSAQARIISNNEVAVSEESVKKPVAVRYGWANYPKVNLYNGDGLPVSPFRTDEWEQVRVSASI